MTFLITLLKILFILASVLLMASPLIAEFGTFRRDKEKKITYKRFRVVVYTAVYVIAVTLALYLLKELILWLETLSFVNWLAAKIALSNRTIYFGQVFVAIAVNFAIGLLYRLFGRFVRIGLKKKDLVNPRKKGGGFTLRQRLERGVIRFFHTESWFFVGSIVKWLSITLTTVYALIFVLYQAPAVFGADWIPYGFISMLFDAGYIYPTITLLALWEISFFLEGVKLLAKECPQLIEDETTELKTTAVDLGGVAEEVGRQFKDYYACDVELSERVQEEVASSSHHKVTKYIAQAVENDERNPESSKEIYLNCLDKILESNKSIIVNGSFFSEFSMYFLRYLSAASARGDIIYFVCNSESQAEEVYRYLNEGFSEISSLYRKGAESDGADYDDPIWRIAKVWGKADAADMAAVADSNILVTSAEFLCSADLAGDRGGSGGIPDIIVLVDALKTVNTYRSQTAMFDAKFGQGAGNLSGRMRYICFDATRIPGLDKVLKNLLAVDFDSVDAMRYSRATMVRCYNYEGRADENGRRVCPQVIHCDEELGVLMNTAVLCLLQGASNVTVFADDSVPYANFAETIGANMGGVNIKVDESKIRMNAPFYAPDDYSVLIALDRDNNLPAAVRRYASMVSDKPSLIILFSAQYMMRDYYIDKLNQNWDSAQMERIPVAEKTDKDIAGRILAKASAGGISKKELMSLASESARFDAWVGSGDISGILRSVLEICGVSQEERIELFRYFEYSSEPTFDDKGVFTSDEKIILKRRDKLFGMINDLEAIVMVSGGKETVLPLPKKRLTQNYIVGQNMLYNGNIYHIDEIDAATGRIETHLAVGGNNDEAYQYVQAREYRVERGPEHAEPVFATKHVVLNRKNGDVFVKEAYISAFRAPMEVITAGYYEIDPHTMASGCGNDIYHSINDPGNDALAKQTYRRYGAVSSPMYSSEAIMSSSKLVANEKGALMLSLKLCGCFGDDVDKTLSLAAVMLGELLRSMFPSVADAVAVCPVLHRAPTGEDAERALKKQPRITTLNDENAPSDDELELVIIEDCALELGVVSVLMSAGGDILKTLFEPVFNYLGWYLKDKKSDYLYFGMDHEPSCFDFESLYKLSGLLGDDAHDLKYIDLDSVTEYTVCDFCGKRYAASDAIAALEDGRRMCGSCAEDLVGNNKKTLKAYLNRAKMFLESTYGITLDDDYDFCFESTVKIVNTLKRERGLLRRGADVPLKAYVDEQKRVHAEYSIPAVNLSELLVRELTHVWQLRHLPDLSDELAEGHIALVAVQYLKFLHRDKLSSARTTYYESTDSDSGRGYRKLVKALLGDPRFHNNPFLYLLEQRGGSSEDELVPPAPVSTESVDYGLRYEPRHPDRVPVDELTYFYYSRLTATCQRAYDVMLDAIKKHAAEAVAEGCTVDDIFKISQAIRFDHPELFWYNSAMARGSTAILLYGASEEEAILLQKSIDEAVTKYLEDIDDSMSAYDVALRMHVKLISSVDYDSIALQKQEQEGGPANDEIDYLRTICGVFIDGKAVCEGYARAMQYLLQKCGIECAEVAGFIHKETGERDGAHAWNILKLDGDYYYLDTTWDDSSNTVQTVKTNDPGFSYFCFTTEELARTRDVELCPTAVPRCDATRCNYFYHNDYVLDSYELDKIKTIARKAVQNGGKAFSFKCKSQAVMERTVEQLFFASQDCHEALKAAAKLDKHIIDDAAYSTDGNMRTIKIGFKYKK